MATSRSGAGGKIVTNRRKQRLSATPYDRPPPRPLPPPPPKSPNWFTGIVVPSARFLASGAGKIFNSIFSDSESYSSEDEGSADDDIDDENLHESPCTGFNTSNKESQLNVWNSDTKWTIEQLILQETFSREECDKLIKVLNSRVTGVGETNLLASSPHKTVDNEDIDMYNKAVQEAKKWFHEKKVGSSSVAELAHEISNINSTGLGHVETGGGSPVDVARSYMKERPPWVSPTGSVELRAPLTTMKLFKGAMYSVGQDSFSSSKKRSSLVSGSWNIQEELRRVRSKATEDMLCTPPAKIDPSLFAVGQNKVEPSGAGQVLFGMGERIADTESSRKTKTTEALVDAGVSSDPNLAAMKSRMEVKAIEAVPSIPITSVSINNEVTFYPIKDSESILVENDCAAPKFLHSSSPNHVEEDNGPGQSTTNGIPETEVAEKQNVDGLSSSQPSLPGGQITEKHDEENNNTISTADEHKPADTFDVEGKCELLSEAYMEVPIVTETDSIASGPHNSLGVQYEELALDTAQPFLEDEKVDAVAEKQQTRKSGRNYRKGRGKGK